MKKRKSIKPTDAELEILQVLWKNGPSTVRFVNDELSRVKDVGYTTTLKLMQIMTEKKTLVRRVKGRTHIYSVVFNEIEVQSILIDRILKTAFDGSYMKLVMQALGNYKPSREELKKIRDLIDKLEKEEQ